MSKKSNKKSPKKKPLQKKQVKKSPARKPASKSVKKAKSKPKAAKKPVKKISKKAKPAPKKKSPAKKKITNKTVKKAVKTSIQKPASKKPVTKPAPQKKAEKPAGKVIAEKAAKPQKAPAKIETAPKQGPVKKVIKSELPPLPKKSVIIDIKTGPEPAGKFELEYIVHSSAQILFEFLTSPSGLSEWFCDDVNIRNGVYSFKWEENEQHARVVKLIEEKLVRFQWVEKHDNSYFEFRIERDDLTNDISLIIVDFAETPEDRASSTLLWNSQIDKLLHVLGSYF
jgi:uncharacterized protein YndB with AHSA1/START domain